MPHHPFALRPAALAAALARLGAAPEGRPGSLRLALPSRVRPPGAAGPIPSWETPDCEPRLAPWRVPALALPPAAALDLARRLPPRPEGAIYGADLRFALNLAWLIRRQLAAGQVLPTLSAQGQRWLALWRATGWDAAELARAMPPAVRAALGEGGAPLPAETVAAELCAALADAACRRALQAADLRPPSRKTQPGARWLSALVSARPAVDAAGPALAALAERLAAWQARDGAARLVFQLEPPPQPGPWRLTWSLALPGGRIVPAAAVWPAGPRPWREAALAALAGAAPLLPALADAPDPAAAPLTPAAAAAFLDAARESDLLVEAPDLCAAPSPLRLTLRQRPGRLGVAGLLDYDWALALGDDGVTWAELQALAEQSAPLVWHRGQWRRIEPEAVAAAAALDPDEAPPPALLSLAAVEAPDAVRALLSGRPLPPAADPPRLRGSLRPYQKQGLSWMQQLSSLGWGGILADDMGLGKTVQVLALLSEAPGPTLLICPLSLLINWQREAARFAPHLSVRVHHGPGRARNPAIFNEDLVLTTYGTAARDAELLSGTAWARIIADEAQRIKNPAAAVTRALRRLPGRWRLALTGTPVENRLEELWSILAFTTPGLLPSPAEFRARYAEPIAAGDAVALDALRRRVGPFLLRRRKTDPAIITDLPPRIDIVEPCRLTREQASLYQATLDGLVQRLADRGRFERHGLILAALTRLKQICDHPALLSGGPTSGRSGKLERLDEILSSILDSGEQVLVFTQFASAGRLLRAHLRRRLDLDAPFLHGGLSQPARQALIDAFQAGSHRVFLLSLKAAGVGLNLTAASHVVHFDRWWNPAVEDQATDRAWRIGQRRAVQVRRLVCAGTIEERIDALIAGKRALAEQVVGEGWVSGLPDEELLSWLALEEGACPDR